MVKVHTTYMYEETKKHQSIIRSEEPIKTYKPIKKIYNFYTLQKKIFQPETSFISKGNLQGELYRHKAHNLIRITPTHGCGLHL
jgi:hypothetical protein